MNDMNIKSSALFTTSGCLTGDALMLYVSGSLIDNERTEAEQHIAECPLCADAADGLRMWLKENKTSETAPGLTEDPVTETPELTGKHAFVKSSSNKSGSRKLNKFHARTNVINERIKKRLYSRSILEATESKRLSYKPFVWVAAAASVVIFIGGFYVVWLQSQLVTVKLAEERASQMLMLQNPANPDTLSILLPDSNGVIAMNKKREKVMAQKTLETAGAEVADEEVFNQDAISISLNEAAIPEPKQGEKFDVENEEVKDSSSDKATPAPTTKNIQITAKRAEIDYETQAVFTIVEEMPSFPGGDIERNKYLSQNIKYPQKASENGIQGTVYVSFLVSPVGKIEDVKILRGIGGGCEEEALRVVKRMPPWKPGKQDGKTVRILYTMPINFKLQ